MFSFDEIKDVCIPTVTNSDSKQCVCMYVCCPSPISLYYEVAYFFVVCPRGGYGFCLMCPTFGLEFISFKTKKYPTLRIKSPKQQLWVSHSRH